MAIAHNTARARWAAEYRDDRKADALWSRFYDRLRPVGLPSFVLISGGYDYTRLSGDALNWRTVSILNHRCKMMHLRSLPAGRLP